jgi:hypothetical protein
MRIYRLALTLAVLMVALASPAWAGPVRGTTARGAGASGAGLTRAREALACVRTRVEAGGHASAVVP